MSKNKRNIEGIFDWLDGILGGYIGLAVAFVALWFFIIFPLALLVWIINDGIPWLLNLIGV